MLVFTIWLLESWDSSQFMALAIMGFSIIFSSNFMFWSMFENKEKSIQIKNKNRKNVLNFGWNHRHAKQTPNSKMLSIIIGPNGASTLDDFVCFTLSK